MTLSVAAPPPGDTNPSDATGCERPGTQFNFKVALTICYNVLDLFCSSCVASSLFVFIAQLKSIGVTGGQQYINAIYAHYTGRPKSLRYIQSVHCVS